jgi:hypothetical protein
MVKLEQSAMTSDDSKQVTGLAFTGFGSVYAEQVSAEDGQHQRVAGNQTGQPDLRSRCRSWRWPYCWVFLE